jgi:hypothetical protein
MYENQRSEIVVRSVRMKDEICRFRSTIRRHEPVLYFVGQSGVLIIAGGYEPPKGREVLGSDMIEVIKLHRWKIDTEPILVKLTTHRISPIILEMDIDNSYNGFKE